MLLIVADGDINTTIIDFKIPNGEDFIDFVVLHVAGLEDRAKVEGFGIQTFKWAEASIIHGAYVCRRPPGER